MMMFDLSHINRQLPALSSLTPLERGGQKLVFRTNHNVYGDVVLKLVPSSTQDVRIEREIDIVTKNHFSHVPELYESGTLTIATSSMLYIIERHIEGQSLYRYLDATRMLSVLETINLLRTLLTTAAELENARLIHRDIKPANIMRGDDGSFWLLDFGIARMLDEVSLTATGALEGPHTRGYAAPEQARNLKSQLDIRADLFSIGVVIYECLTGENPFIKHARDMFDIDRKTATLNLRRLVVPGDTVGSLSGFIDVLTSKAISQRPRTARQALDWFEALLPTISL